MNKEKKRIIRAVLKLAVLLGIAIIIGIFILIAVFHSELRMITSIKKLSSKRTIYEMTWDGNYGLEKYLRNGAKNEIELGTFFSTNFTHGIGAGTPASYERGCSSFTAITPEGDYILARNLDQQVDNVPGIIHTKRSEQYDTMGLCNMCWCGWNRVSSKLSFQEKTLALSSPYLTLDGINEKGLSACLLTARGSKAAEEKGKITLCDLTIVRVLLDKAGTVDEAIEILKNYNVFFISQDTSHYMVADAGGNSAVIEYVNGEMKVLYKTDAYQICSNFILYNNPDKRGFGSDRYMAYEEYLNSTKGVITMEDALTLLEDNTIPGCAQWSVVYNLTQKTVYLAVYPEYDRIYKYSLTEQGWELKKH